MCSSCNKNMLLFLWSTPYQGWCILINNHLSPGSTFFFFHTWYFSSCDSPKDCCKNDRTSTGNPLLYLRGHWAHAKTRPGNGLCFSWYRTSVLERINKAQNAIGFSFYKFPASCTNSMLKRVQYPLKNMQTSPKRSPLTRASFFARSEI